MYCQYISQVLSFHIPSVKDKSQNPSSQFPQHALAPKPVVLRSIVEYDIYNTLIPLLPHLGRCYILCGMLYIQHSYTTAGGGGNVRFCPVLTQFFEWEIFEAGQTGTFLLRKNKKI